MLCGDTLTVRNAASLANSARSCARRWQLPSDSDIGADGIRRTTRYDIDLFKCIYCGFCEEACPVDAIVETRIQDYHMENRDEQIMTKEMLLAVGDKHEATIVADRMADAPYR